MDELKAAVDSLAAGGFTNHTDAFAKATALFDPNSTNAKVMVMFTDGKTTAGPDPSVQVDCGTVVQPEPCPVPIDVAVSGCRDALEYDLGDVYLESAGADPAAQRQSEKRLSPQARGALHRAERG